MPFIIPGQDVAAVPDTQSPWYETDIAILVAGIAGIGVLTGCEVTAQGSPDMTVAVASGTIQSLAGVASVAVTGANKTITAADGTDPRIDLVSASAAGVLTVTNGTAAAAPKPPSLPSGHIALAMVDVPANDTTIGTAQITDKRAMVFAGVADILDLPTAETVTTKVLAPNGAGGVEFRAEAGGGLTDPTSSVGDIIYRGPVGGDLNIVGGVVITGGPSGWSNLPSAIDNNDGTTASQADWPPTNHWLKVDLGVAKTVVATRLASSNSRPPDFTIESSTDDVNWGSRLVKTGPPQDTGVLSLSTPATAQYWRITANSDANTYWGVSTWALFPPGSLGRLPIGTTGQVLTVVSGLPAWATP